MSMPKDDKLEVQNINIPGVSDRVIAVKHVAMPAVPHSRARLRNQHPGMLKNGPDSGFRLHVREKYRNFLTVVHESQLRYGVHS